MPFQRTLEMSLTREEFLRVLPAAVNAFQIDGDRVSWVEANGSGAIRLVTLPDWRLGSVALPRLRVEIALFAASEAEGEAFMTRFRAAYMRGGG